MPELIPKTRASVVFLNFPLLDMEHVRTVLNRKLLRSGFEGEDVVVGGTLGGLIHAAVVKPNKMGC